MKESGLSHQRYSEFDKERGEIGHREITPYYFLRLCKGIGLLPEEVEIMSGKKFTHAQREDLGFYRKVESEKEVLKLILSDPKKLKKMRDIANEK